MSFDYDSKTFPIDIENFSTKIYEINDDLNLGSMLILNLDDKNHQYSFVMYINTIVTQGHLFSLLII